MTVTRLEPEEPVAISLAEVAEKRLVPLSKTTLYRIAESGDGPFRKRGGKWMTTREDLEAWVRSAPKPSRSIGNPMPRVRGRRSSFAAKLANLEGSS